MIILFQIERLLELKDICIELEAQEILTETITYLEWESLNTICKILTPAKIATKVLQGENLTLSDMYACWINLKLRLEPYKNMPLGKNLLHKLTSREKKIIDIPLVHSAVYLDLRYQCLLSQDEKKEALSYLVNLWERYYIYRNSNAQSVSSSIQVMPIDEDDPMEKLLQSKASIASSNSLNISLHVNKERILSALGSFNNIYRIDKKTNIFSFWKEKKNLHPELYELATIVFAVPSTQVSVERAFSSLTFIYNDLRTNMNSNILEKVLLIRLNKVVFDEITLDFE